MGEKAIKGSVSTPRWKVRFWLEKAAAEILECS
jgi:hypothetical protein